MTVEKAWSRATAPGVEIGVGYLTIKNEGDAPDRLLSVTTPVADKTEIHQTQMTDGKMQMRPVPDGIPIPTKGTLTLELNNLTRVPIKLYPGLLIAQLSFMGLDRAAVRPYGSKELGSHYQGQVAATESRYMR